MFFQLAQTIADLLMGLLLSDYFRACALAGGKPPEDIAAYLPWNIKERKEKTWKYCGRVFSESKVACIRSIIDEDTSRNRTAISRIVCEQLQWYKPDGTVKWQSMRQVLVRMEADGHIILPPLLRTHLTQMKPIEHTERTAREEILLPVGKLPDI